MFIGKVAAVLTTTATVNRTSLGGTSPSSKQDAVSSGLPRGLESAVAQKEKRKSKESMRKKGQGES